MLEVDVMCARALIVSVELVEELSERVRDARGGDLRISREGVGARAWTLKW